MGCVVNRPNSVGSMERAVNHCQAIRRPHLDVGGRVDVRSGCGFPFGGRSTAVRIGGSSMDRVASSASAGKLVRYVSGLEGGAHEGAG